MMRRRGRRIRRELSGADLSRAGIERRSDHEGRIPLKSFLLDFQSPEGGPGLVEIYRTEVLPIKTRTLHLLGRKCSAKIINTLLGYEVQASYKRIQCPDLVTARYLKLFTELGCRIIKLPYDLTVTGRIVPGLEAAIHRLHQGVSTVFAHKRRVQTYVIQRLYEHLRHELQLLGSGQDAASASPGPGETGPRSGAAPAP